MREFRFANWSNGRAARKEFIRPGKPRASAVPQRSEALPDVPTVSEFVDPDAELVTLIEQRVAA